MKTSTLTFAEGFLATNANVAKAKGAVQIAFDWDKAASIIKAAFDKHPDLVAEAGLDGDWNYTGGVIFENGKPTKDHYTFLSSNWATPTLILSWDDEEQEEIDCWAEHSERLNSQTKWDETSLSILGIDL